MRIVEIEVTNRCNTRCLHCPHDNISRPKGLMGLDTFQILADKILAFGKSKTVDFAGMGEPMLNPHLYRFIKYFSGKIDTYLTTNASLLTPPNIERLLDANLTSIIVSFNGGEVGLYERMMGGLSFKQAEFNLADLVRLTKSKMQVVANVSITVQTENYLKNIKTYLNNMGIRNILFSKCHSRGGHLKNPLICNTPMPPLNTDRCDIYANTLFVAWTGEVLACCQDLDGVAPLGNLITESIENILDRKQLILQHGVSYQMCRNCNDLYRFSKDHLPEGRPISEWLYHLYLNPQESAGFFNQVIKRQEKKINKLSLLLQLENLVTFLFLRRYFLSHYKQKNYQSRLIRLLTIGRPRDKSEEITLMDWMSLLYREADQITANFFFVIQRQKKEIEALINKSKIAYNVLEVYIEMIGLIDWMKSLSLWKWIIKGICSCHVRKR
jgi:hypothetical protein